ncbi:MAG TPA: NADH-quinone oxidoreductase subunit N [Planctomycetes bacterium]|nr:NADH-quinone oxidoreductase subunit N [Planctomycetota bacterium]
MSFYELIQQTIDDTVIRSLPAFLPELAVCATIVLLLLVRMLDGRQRVHPFVVMFLGSAVALYLAAPWRYLGQGGIEYGPIFSGMLVFDPFAVYMRSLLLFFALLFATFAQTTGVPEPDQATEFYVLILGATLGMCLMVAANHMLMVFLAIEMASVPSYVLAGLLRHRPRSSEAALKFAVFGAATAGVMLYGISLLVGLLGSAHIPTMARQLAALLAIGPGNQETTVLVLGGMMLAVGLAFKLSAVPFHFWTPDVFEGATAEVAAFLSIASKAAALALVVRIALGLGHVAGPGEMTRAEADRPAVVLASLPGAAHADPPAARSVQSPPSDPLAPARRYIVGIISLLAAVTCTFGNLAAYGQQNMKRLLAYSTIAHAGYMMMAVAAAVELAGEQPGGARSAVAALAFYMGIYLFMNLGAFAVVAFLRNALASEQIDDYAGLVRRSPGLAVCTAVVLFSLVGLPPLAGFAAKFTVFAALFNARLLTLLAIGAVNTVLSLFYYLRVVKVMMLHPEPEHRPAPTIPLASAPGAYCLILAVPIVLLGIWWNGLFHWAKAATATLLF